MFPLRSDEVTIEEEDEDDEGDDDKESDDDGDKDKDGEEKEEEPVTVDPEGFIARTVALPGVAVTLALGQAPLPFHEGLETTGGEDIGTEFLARLGELLVTPLPGLAASGLAHTHSLQFSETERPRRP